MVLLRITWRYGLTCLLALAGCVQAVAQTVKFTTEVSAGKIGLKDQLQVTYTIRDAQNVQQMAPSLLPDFDIVAGPFQSQNSSISVIGNRAVQSVSISL